MTKIQNNVVPVLSDRFIELRTKIAHLPDRNYRKEVKAISRAVRQIDSKEEQTRLISLIYGQTGEAPYDMHIAAEVWYRCDP